MTSDRLYSKSLSYLNTLCHEITERCVGSEGNRQATYFFEKELTSLGWETTMPEFDAMDWEENGAVLRSGETYFDVFVSPYTLGFKGEAELVSASSVTELENLDGKGKFILLMGEIVKEQLMPKNFVFYNPEEHQ